MVMQSRERAEDCALHAGLAGTPRALVSAPARWPWALLPPGTRVQTWPHPLLQHLWPQGHSSSRLHRSRHVPRPLGTGHAPSLPARQSTLLGGTRLGGTPRLPGQHLGSGWLSHISPPGLSVQTRPQLVWVHLCPQGHCESASHSSVHCSAPCRGTTAASRSADRRGQSRGGSELRPCVLITCTERGGGMERRTGADHVPGVGRVRNPMATAASAAPGTGLQRGHGAGSSLGREGQDVPAGSVPRGPRAPSPLGSAGWGHPRPGAWG